MAEANRDEALRCFELSRRFHAQKEYELAHKYAEKSVRLYVTDRATSWLEITKRSVEDTVHNGPSPAATGPAADTTGSPLNGDSASAEKGAKKRDVPPKSSFSREQAEEVRRFLSIDKNDFYAVLGLKRGTDDNEIKKAYRKLALQFHPDKNHAPGADEAFKVVSRAFSCLSDPDKRAQYDRFGAADGVSPMGPAGASGGVRFRGPSMFEADISPEELFNLFFGGGMPMGNGGGFAFASGNAFGPMFVHSFNGGMPSFYPPHYHHHQQRRRRGNHPFTAGERAPQPTGLVAWAMQLLPMLIMALIVLLSNWTSSPSTSSEWDSISRHVSLDTASSHPHAFITNNMRIPYYGTSMYRDYFASNTTSSSLQGELANFEKIIERHYVSRLQQQCREQERDLQNRRAQAAASGVADPTILEPLRNEKCPACEQLHALGIKK